MTTSGTYSFSNTRNDMIDQAYRNIGVLPSGQNLTAEQYDEAGKILNTMIKSWRGQGILIQTLDWISIGLRQSNYVVGSDGKTYECMRNHVSSVDNQPITGINYLTYWRVSIDSVIPLAWVAGSNYVSLCNYDLDINITGVKKGFYRLAPDASSGSPNPFDRVIQITTQSEYFELGNKALGGKSVLCYFKRSAQPQIYLYPYPLFTDIGKVSVNLSVMRFPQDMNDPADNTDFLPEWEEAIIYGLSWRLCIAYGVESSVANMIKSQANEALIMARGMDEDNTNIQFKLDLKGHGV